ncbi:MAG: Crp/Fnr family transcriptional regulator [Chitinophagaceae bacterium]
MSSYSLSIVSKPVTDVSALVQVLNYLHPISPEIAEYLSKHTSSILVRKKKLLLKPGMMCNHLYFIKKGALRGFAKEDNKEITTWITAENEMVTSIARLSKYQPSREYIQAIENSELLCMHLDDLENLYNAFPAFNIVGRKLLQTYYGHAEERAFVARVTKAEDKYRYFIENQQHLVNRIPLTYIASYLGITLETLSKVRSRLAAKINVENIQIIS